MSRTLKDIGWVVRNDGEPDRRYAMPQVLNYDGSRDRRFDLFQQPTFGPSQLLTQGRSQYYNGIDAHAGPGVYQLMTMPGMGRPTTQYSGMSNDLSRRLDEHGRGGWDNLASPMHQAAIRGMDVRARFAPADGALEARAQELLLLGQREYSWNSRNNGGFNPHWAIWTFGSLTDFKKLLDS
ncbi:unnamed protein product [Adineta steineri]|uniref:Uncharacterized protein n=1 Tax=Adineta steineri TaxID=433720 RepID=A0A818GV86_9BILA|nr:unnamed protein product [Adineta steineri]